MIHIDHEAPTESGAREALLDRVMGPARTLKPSERLREGRLPVPGLSFVARDRARLVGSVRLWNVIAGGAPALLLGPLAIDPTVQGNGVGSGLMQVALNHAGVAGHKAVILVGDPEFYERFGFAADPTDGLLMPAPVERRRFLGLELTRKGLAGAEGRVTAAGEPDLCVDFRRAA